METRERKELIKTLSAQNASDSMDVFEGPTWGDMCAIVAEEDPDARMKRMEEMGMIDAGTVQRMAGLSPEEKIVAADSSILMTLSDMMRKRAELLNILAAETRFIAVTNVVSAKMRRDAKHE